jgi:C4-dicarboxylate-specific signal transduction histidine kinase
MVLQRVHPEDLAFVQRTIEGAARDGKDFRFEHRLLMTDGSVKHVHAVARVVKEATGSIEFVGAVMDVTAAKRAEDKVRNLQTELAHAARVATLGELTASIAHEVNQPLAGLVNSGSACLRWLASEPPNIESARQSLGRIIRDANRASEVVGRVRNLAKKDSLEKVWLSINETVLETIGLTRMEVAQHRASLNAQLSDDVPLVWGDRIQLQQVILNLIINALEAVSPVGDGPRDLLVSTAKHESDGVLLTVRDSGVGLTPANLERIFDAFYTTKREGMGMGLAVSRSIIEMHGGRLWATPNEPRGAVFQFTLPSSREELS